MKMNPKDVLLIVDVQHDFLPGGALAVPDGDQIIPVINAVQGFFEKIVATQDWHPADHLSFAANHPDKNSGDRILLDGVDQVLWPVHCVQGSYGSEFSKALDASRWRAIFQKGTQKQVDSYSGFYDNARQASTGLGDFLLQEGVSRVFIVGLALDYCVKFTALDALSLGFDTFLIQDATRAVNLDPSDGKHALIELEAAGVHCIDSTYFNPHRHV